MANLRQDGAAIRRLRRQRGIKASELAERVYVSRVTVWNVEGGHQQASWELLYRLKAALDVPLVELLSDQGRTEHREQVSA